MRKEIIEKLDKEFLAEVVCSACSGCGVIQNPLWKGITAKMSDKEIRNYFAERGYYDTLPREEEICQRCDGKGKRVRSVDEQIEYLHNRDRQLIDAITEAVGEREYKMPDQDYKTGYNHGLQKAVEVINSFKEGE